MASHFELAILAMDSYNRAGAGLNLRSNQLGRFEVSEHPSSQPEISFLAQAYTAGSDVIIS